MPDRLLCTLCGLSEEQGLLKQYGDDRWRETTRYAHVTCLRLVVVRAILEVPR